MTAADSPERIALAVDDLLGTLTAGDMRELLDWVEHHAPPAWRALHDQQCAAAADTLAALREEAVTLGGTGLRQVPHLDVPDWIRLGVIVAYSTWVAGKARTCVHAPSAARPEPVFAPAWRPGLVVCARCPHLLSLPRTSAVDRTCDRCGRVVAGVEHDDGIHPGRAQYGPLALLYGTCRDCLPWEAQGASS